MSVGEDPLWVVPYTTIAADFQDLLQDQDAYIDVRNHLCLVLMLSQACKASACTQTSMQTAGCCSLLSRTCCMSWHLCCRVSLPQTSECYKLLSPTSGMHTWHSNSFGDWTM